MFVYHLIVTISLVLSNVIDKYVDEDLSDAIVISVTGFLTVLDRHTNQW